ncbi:MAG: hypothetical protein ACTSX7_01225 [Alphaproteobacteria bacterium]
MIKSLLVAVTVVGLSLQVLPAAQAGPLDGLTALQKAKVARTIASSRSSARTGLRQECGSVIIGSGAENSRRARKEVIIVARDIININRNCKIN